MSNSNCNSDKGLTPLPEDPDFVSPEALTPEPIVAEEVSDNTPEQAESVQPAPQHNPSKIRDWAKSVTSKPTKRIGGRDRGGQGLETKELLDALHEFDRSQIPSKKAEEAIPLDHTPASAIPLNRTPSHAESRATANVRESVRNELISAVEPIKGEDENTLTAQNFYDFVPDALYIGQIGSKSATGISKEDVGVFLGQTPIPADTGETAYITERTEEPTEALEVFDELDTVAKLTQDRLKHISYLDMLHIVEISIINAENVVPLGEILPRNSTTYKVLKTKINSAVRSEEPLDESIVRDLFYNLVALKNVMDDFCEDSRFKRLPLSKQQALIGVIADLINAFATDTRTLFEKKLGQIVGPIMDAKDVAKILKPILRQNVEFCFQQIS